MSNRNEQIAKTRRRVARRMMRTQILSFYGLERRIQNRQRQRRAGKDERAVCSLRAELAFLKAHGHGSGSREPRNQPHREPCAPARALHTASALD